MANKPTYEELAQEVKGLKRVIKKHEDLRANRNSSLHRKPEMFLADYPSAIKKIPPTKIQSLVEDFHIHKIELEMQNEELRRAQMELEEARNRYVNLYDFAPVGYFTMGYEGLIQETNITGATMLGVVRKNLINQPFSRFITNDTQDIFYLHRQKLIETRTRQGCELKLRKKDGTEFHAQLECVVVEDDEGNIEFFRAAVIDIQERKRAEEALRESEEELQIRNRILNIFFTISDDNMYGEVLEVVLDVMKSKYGVFGFIEENGALVCPSMTKDIWDQCQIPDKDVVFPRNTWGGIWGKCLVEKESLFSNVALNVPEGHVPIERALVVPIIYQGETIGMLLVANKGKNYSEKDLTSLEEISQNIAPVLGARLQRDKEENDRRKAEEALRELNLDLERQVKIKTAEMSAELVEHMHTEEMLRKSEQKLRIKYDINNIFLVWPDEKMYEEMLGVVLRAMKSKYGTFGYFDEQGSFVAPAVTRRIYWEKCDVPDKDIIFHKGTFGGIWGKSLKERKTLIDNDGPFGTPEGHISIKNTIASPIIFRDEIVSALHLANKPGGYGEEDREMLETIISEIAPVLHARVQRDRQEKERKQAEGALRVTEKQLQEALKKEYMHAFTHGLMKAQEDERKMISCELHDRVAQDLSALKIDCDLISGDTFDVSLKISKKFKRISNTLQNTITAIRDLSYELRPPGLDQMSLLEVIFHYCEEFSEKTGLNVDFTSAGMDSLHLNRDAEINFYRLIQEGLNNILKHAGANHATIKLTAAHPDIILRISDDGRGFDVKERRANALNEKRMGLSSMEERVNLLKGAIKIQSHAGEGTKVLIEVPYKENRGEA